MEALESLSVKHLRSLVSPVQLSLVPVTLLVGANSSGKSTLLRLVPLLRQSIETNTRGPILWYGRLVDFGLFEDAHSKQASAETIEFGFNVKISQEMLDKLVRYPYLASESLHGRYSAGTRTVSVSLTLTLKGDQQGTYLDQLSVTIHGCRLLFRFNANGVVQSAQVAGEDFTLGDWVGTLIGGTSLVRFVWSTPRTQTLHLASGLTDPFSRPLLEMARRFLHRRTKHETILHFLSSLPTSTVSQLRAHMLDSAGRQESKAWVSSDHNPWAIRFHSLLLASRIHLVLRLADEVLSGTFSTSTYIAPLRATAQRYYRQQDLSVDEIDPQGSNLAMFLLGLTPDEQQQFAGWTEQTVGFRIRAHRDGAHVSVKLAASGKDSYVNIADMGFGYSQVLPVLASIWAKSKSNLRSSRTRRLQVPSIIAIEQPELHLHPNLQSRLADLLAGIVGQERKTPVRFLCETHSEAIVNRFGILIAKGRLAPDQVQVLVFEKPDDEVGTVVKKVHYDESGSLVGWPYDFFLPSAE